jgi:F0F1-type ATP synthase assembly protein I
MSEEHDWRRAARRRFIAPIVIAVIGVVIGVATDGVAQIVGWGLFAVALTIAISLVFLEVGLSEDRARAAEEAERARRRRRP